jgi:glutathione synthase/RimK-type ligase-like ATP-grasp enzyme
LEHAIVSRGFFFRAMTCKRKLAELVREIAEDHDLELKSLSHEWILMLGDGSAVSRLIIYGYNFGINSAPAALVCQDKSATYLCLHEYGIPCVPHELFFNPTDPLVSGYIASSVGSVGRILNFCKEQYNNQVVIKPLKGTGGIGVLRASNALQIEAAIVSTFQKDYGLVVSPYLEIVDEIRAVVLRGQVKVLFRKRRAGVVGDGITPLATLVSTYISTHPTKSTTIDLKSLPLESIPSAGEFVPFEWRHNLGHGAENDAVDDKDNAISELAVSAAAALQMKFCSVDMVRAADQLLVLEVNAGVMMESFAASSEANRAKTKGIYEEAILFGLGMIS